MWPDFRYAARTLISARLFTGVAVTCLALSIATNTTMFSVFDAIFWRPLPFAQSDQLVSIAGRHPETGRRVALSLDDVRGLAESTQSLTGIAAYSGRTVTLTDGSEPERISAQLITANLFSTLGIPLHRGHGFEIEDDKVSAAPVAVIGEALWRRFKTAQDAVFGRTSAHLAAQNEERTQNLARKQSLCERAEALSVSTDWVKTATALQALQAEWKTVGPVSRGSEKAIWERFRAACDQFFSRRHDDLKKRKDEWSENLARKEALCARAEALASGTDWEAAAAECKKLQVEWKQIGPVRRSKSDAVWQRFRTACDAFFDRYKHRDQVDLQSKAAARAEVIHDLEALTSAEAAADAVDEQLTREGLHELLGSSQDHRAQLARTVERRPVREHR